MPTTINAVVGAPMENRRADNEFRNVFTQNGKLSTGYEYRIEVDPDAVPYAPPARRIPPALLPKIKVELEGMVADDIIEEVTEPSAWCAPTVVAYKKSGSLRICADLRRLNQVIRREPIQMPTLDELCAKVSGSKLFSVLDCKNSYWQVPIAKESQHLLTFSTPLGRFRYKRLCFGLSSAPEVYQRVMYELLKDFQGVVNYIDDIFLFAETVEQHDEILTKVLKHLADSGIRLNEEKCQIRKKAVTFLGHNWSDSGISPGLEKLAAIREMPVPPTRESLRSFLGFATYVGAHFVPHFSARCKPLWELVSKEEFGWTERLKQTFYSLRQSLSDAHTRAYFDATKPITIQSDACGLGLGATLLQEGHPVLFASRSLTSVETRYSQIEREFLAIVFALTRFRLYLLGAKCRPTVHTDHLPILGLLSKPIDQLSNRIQRWMIVVQQYECKFMHIPGKDNLIADALSRNAIPYPVSEPEDVAEVTICMVMKAFPLQLKEVAMATQQDDALLQVIEAVKVG